MLMKEELVRLVIEGKKLQTRRPIKAGEALVTVDGVRTVTMANGKRIKYQVGREYSLQYGRGLPTRLWHKDEGLMDWAFYRDSLANQGQQFLEISKLMGWHPLKYKLLDVWAEDVRGISYENSKLEGFSCADEFLCTWTNFYDAKLDARYGHHGSGEEEAFVIWVDPKVNKSLYISRDVEGSGARPADFSNWLKTRHPDLYLGWALAFEVVKHG